MFRRLLIALDRFLNVLLGGADGETISARAWRLEQRGSNFWRTSRRLIDKIFGAGHCQRSFEHELTRYNEPREYQR